MPNNVIELVIRATDRATPVIRGLNVTLGKLAFRAAAGAAGAFAFVLRAVIRATAEAQMASAKLDAAYQATGGAVGKTREELDQLGEELQRTTTFSKTLVSNAQALLLTFNQVRGEAFERTLRAAADLSSMLGTDLTSATRLVGLALQDPARGMTALRRAGVAFDEAQRKVIKQLVDTGQAAKAQEVILKELESRVGGTAAALRNTLPGALQAVRNAWGDLLEQSKEGSAELVKSVNDLTTILEETSTKQAANDFFQLFIDGAAKAIQAVVGLGAALNLVGNESVRIDRRLEFLRGAGKFGGLSTGGPSSALGDAAGVFVTPAEVQAEIKRLEQRQREILGLGGAGVAAAKQLATASTAIVPLTEAQIKALDDWASAAERVNQKYAEQRALLESIKTGRAADSEEVRDATAALARLNVAQKRELADLAKSLEIEPVLITSKWDNTFRQWELDTRTGLERNIAEWHEFNAKLKALVGEGPPGEGLPQTIADARRAAKLDELLAPIVVTVKRIDPKPFQELTGAALRAAEQIQDAFANAFRNIFDVSLRDSLKNFARAILEIPIQALAQDFGERMRKALKPTIEKLFDPGKKAREEAQARAVEAAVPTVWRGGGGVIRGATEAQQKAAEIVAEIKRNAATSNAPVVEAVNNQTRATVETVTTLAQSLCECICGCLTSLKEAIQRGPDAVVEAVGGQTDAEKAVAKTASKDVVTGVDTSVKTATASINATVTDVGNQIVGALAGQGGGGNDLLGAIQTGLKLYMGGGFAGGGFTPGGVVKVGEAGPEKVLLPPGSRVMNQRQLAFAGDGAKQVNLYETHHITITGANDADDTQKRLSGYLVARDAKLEQRIYERLRANGFGRMR